MQHSHSLWGQPHGALSWSLAVACALRCRSGTQVFEKMAKLFPQAAMPNGGPPPQ